MKEKTWQEQLSALIYEYLDKCKKENLYPNKAGFRQWARINKKDFFKDKINFDVIKDALRDLEEQGFEYLVQNGLQGKTNPVITKLLLSANYGLKERSDVTTDDKPIPILSNVPTDKSFEENK